ncbi:GNAT family N-acetyltransferase [Streptomyces sp. UNOC14_S4]|uniref:GNAT family N-acetyltransferase n=1 Tax=Streptomyces sp. UNOC14_S4 TaxID=2872340 RepID=UPI001E5BE95F|nr:GNAT family N-acetyltransferase [Streptomyces sp. UNOC14_S4]MCC3771266.1 hypothetical protein [Streptomyces sp. UNOC14_S4]
MTDWPIAALGPRDRQAVAEAIGLTEAALGHGTLTVERALECLHDRSLLLLAAYAGKPGVMVGAAAARVLDDGGYRDLVAPMPRGLLPAAPPSADGRRVGQLNTLSVAAPMRGRGLGGAFASRLTAWLREQCTEAYALAWLHDRPGRSDGLLKAHGWRPVAVLDEYWLGATTAGDRSCPVCGRPCHCSGLLLRMPGRLL